MCSPVLSIVSRGQTLSARPASQRYKGLEQFMNLKKINQPF